MIFQKRISTGPYSEGFHLITDIILRELKVLPETGLVNIFLQHTSAALAINENADPTVRYDFKTFFKKLVPENFPGFTHTIEGNDDMPSHIKSSIFGQSLVIPIVNHRVALGTWQGIYLCEFRRNGGKREIIITVLGE
ncbi:MAG: secondary thiamine-phosphate synthase enzyme YjbQ [Bacteroidales bacterium]|nr:secondary thiamine-phosphate synthase enzyme YjbQ [Bacteroidales bacterium]